MQGMQLSSNRRKQCNLALRHAQSICTRSQAVSREERQAGVRLSELHNVRQGVHSAPALKRQQVRHPLN